MTEPERADRIEALLLSEPAAARITPALVEEMLSGFPLPPLMPFVWFVEEIRLLVWVVARQRVPKGNAEKRDDLLALAQRLRDLWQDIRTFARHVSDEEFKLVRELEKNRDGYPERRLLAAFYDNDETLVWRAKFFEALAVRCDENKQPPKWRAKAKREWRVRIALQLMPVFEKGFGRKATLDKWPSTTGGKALGVWAEFYQRVMAATLGEERTPDLEGVLTEARKELGSSGYSPGDFIGE